MEIPSGSPTPGMTSFTHTTLTTGAGTPAWNLTCIAITMDPGEIWSDGEIVWVMDAEDKGGVRIRAGHGNSP